MPRINVEDELYLDSRFNALVKIEGCRYKAIGLCVSLWAVAQKYWCDNKQLIPPIIYDLEDFKSLEKVGLVTKLESGYYAAGSEDRFTWILQKQEAGRIGGLKSAKRRSSTRQAPLDECLSAGNPPTPVPTPVPTPTREDTYVPPKREDAPEHAVFLNTWNLNCGGLPRAQALTKQRKAKIASRLKEKADLLYWEACVKRMAASEFCNSGNWANIDWLIANDTNHIKVLEGKYDKKEKPLQAVPKIVDDTAEFVKYMEAKGYGHKPV